MAARISHLSRTCHLKGRYIAGIFAELYPDQVNWLIQTPVFVRFINENSHALPAVRLNWPESLSQPLRIMRLS